MDITLAAQIALWILAVLFTLVGVSGLVFPVLPGAPLLFTGLFLAAWADGFAHVGAGAMVLLGIMALLTYVVDFAASAVGARRFGASRRAVIGAVIGAVVGLFFGLVGVIVGPFIGAVIGELSVRLDFEAASRAGFGATIGLALGAAAKLAMAFAMLGIFLIFRFF
ncbi:MAG: DUF456 domain-containing protein [Desulfobacterales bacterium]|nr:DUF456 domain-containing protein [Desulfobacterales bacterium]